MFSLRWFQASEFDDPLRMDPEFVHFLDDVRDACGIPFRLTSDFRTPEHNEAVGGSSKSLHLLGRAVDFVPVPWNTESLWKIVAAVTSIAERDGLSVELELVSSDTDHHVHLGLHDSVRPSRLVLAID